MDSVLIDSNPIKQHSFESIDSELYKKDSEFESKNESHELENYNENNDLNIDKHIPDVYDHDDIDEEPVKDVNDYDVFDQDTINIKEDLEEQLDIIADLDKIVMEPIEENSHKFANISNDINAKFEDLTNLHDNNAKSNDLEIDSSNQTPEMEYISDDEISKLKNNHTNEDQKFNIKISEDEGSQSDKEQKQLSDSKNTSWHRKDKQSSSKDKHQIPVSIIKPIPRIKPVKRTTRRVEFDEEKEMKKAGLGTDIPEPKLYVSFDNMTKKEIENEIELLKSQYIILFHKGKIEKVPKITFENIEDLKNQYDRLILKMKGGQMSGLFKLALILIWVLLEIVANKFGLNASGFTAYQMKLLSAYDDLLLELGEQYQFLGGFNWRPEISLIVITVLSLVVFVLCKYLVPIIGEENSNIITNAFIMVTTGKGGNILNKLNDYVNENVMPVVDGMTSGNATSGGNPMQGLGEMFGNFDIGAAVNGIGKMFGGMANQNQTKTRRSRNPKYEE